MAQWIAAENIVIALSFFSIAGLIFIGLLRDRLLGVNPLGIATGLVFFSCAMGHSDHAFHYLVEPDIYGADPDLWHQLVVDGFTVAAGVWYLAQRRRYGLVIRGSNPMIDYQRRLQMAEALRDIGQDIAAQTDFDRLLRRVVQHARDLLGADYAAIVTVDASGKPHRQVIGARGGGWDDVAWNAAVFLGETKSPGSILVSRQPVVIKDLLPILTPNPDQHEIHRAEGGRTLLAVPIFHGDRVIGSLMVAYRKPHHLIQEDLSSLDALSSQAAIAIENARLIERLKRADHLKDEFLSAAAHELKTPITTIKGWTQLLLRPDCRGVDERTALETICRQSDRISRLSEDLLAVVRLQPGLPALNLERFDLSLAAQGLVEQMRRTEDGRVFVIATSGPAFVEADQCLITELLGRLLENAIRYSPAGTPVEVEVSRTEREVVVSVRDHGVGVSLDRQPHIFEPFYEPVPSGQEGYVGIVSLGLYLGKLVLEAHGGRIWFTSTPGKGSVFSFSLSAV